MNNYLCVNTKEQGNALKLTGDNFKLSVYVIILATVVVLTKFPEGGGLITDNISLLTSLGKLLHFLNIQEQKCHGGVYSNHPPKAITDYIWVHIVKN